MEEALAPVEMARAITPVVVLDELWGEGVLLTELSRRLSLSPFFQKRKVCSCFNTTITKSKVHEGEAL